MRKLIAIILLMVVTKGYSQLSDNEVNLLLTGKNYTTQIAICDSLITVYGKDFLEECIGYKTRTIEIAFANNDELLAARKLTGRAKMYKLNNELEKAINDIQKAYPIVIKHHDAKLIQACYFELGLIYYRKSELSAAMNNFLKALMVAESETKDTAGIVSLTNNIGNIMLTQGQFDKAITYYKKALELNKSRRDIKSTALTIDNIAVVYVNKGDYKTALKYQQQAAELIKSLHDPKLLSDLQMNSGAVYNMLGQHDLAMGFFLSAYALSKELGDKSSIAAIAANISDVHRIKKNYQKAVEYAMESYRLARESDSPLTLRIATETLSQIYEEMNLPVEALRYYKEFSKVKDSILNIENVSQINEWAAKFESAQKQKEIALLTKEKELSNSKVKQKSMINLFLYAGIGFALILLILLFNRIRIKQKANIQLEEKNYAINVQKAIVEEKNKEITDSINYAQRIQQALLLPEANLKEHFNDIFIIYQPKDIVSGDFYWFAESSKNKIIAVADCTGHGVPGGFMSMMGYEMLQDVLLKENITTTNHALKTLDLRVTETLNKTGKNFRDGMDMVLCAFSKSDNTLLYSGANRPLLQISEGVLIEHQPDKNTIGGDVDGVEKEYRQHIIHFKEGDMFYLFTDGYADQFGGPKQKKFKYKRMKELLLELHRKNLTEQKEALIFEYQSWKGDVEQVDDISIIGIRV